MTDAERRDVDDLARDASRLRILAAHIRGGTLATWDIPNTIAGTIEGIADRLIERGVAAIATDTTLEAYRAGVEQLSGTDPATTPKMRLRYRQVGAHMRCRFFTNGWTGTLVFGLDEWDGVRAMLGQVIDVMPEDESHGP